MRIARANAAWPAVASSPVRCGSSEVWIAWNSCSGARAISSTLNTMPASALLGEVASTVSTAAFSSVCSESMMPDTQRREAGAAAQRELVVRAASCTPSVPGPASAGVGLVDGDRRRRRASPPAALRARVRANASGHDDQRDERRGGDAERHGGLPAGDARAPRRARSRCARATPSARGRRTARSVRGRPASRARSSWRRRRACRPRARRRAPAGGRTRCRRARS